MATSEDLYLATSGDFLMATDTKDGQRVTVLFSCGVQVAAQGAECSCAGHGSQAPGDLLADLDWADGLLG